MHTHSLDIGASLTRNPENNQVPIRVILKELTFVDGPNPELALDGGDQGGTLEDGAGKGFEGAGDLGDVGDGGVEAGDADVFFTGALLGLDEAGGAVDADDEVTGDLGVEGTGVAGFFDAEEALDPGDDLVGGRVGGLVEVEDAVFEVLGEGALQGGVAGGDGGVVAGADIETLIVFEEDGPLGGVDWGSEALRLDHQPAFVFRFFLSSSSFVLATLLLLLLLAAVGVRHGSATEKGRVLGLRVMEAIKANKGFN